jgi:hypothetical protein
MKNQRQYYAYLWLRSKNGKFPAGTPYYAGKGHGRRAYDSRRIQRCPKDQARIVIFNRASEQEALDTEMELIRNWGRIDLGTGCLHNHSDGGEGLSGPKPEKTKQKMREAALKNNRTGWHHNAAAKKKISEYNKGNTHNLGRKNPPQLRQSKIEILRKHRGDQTERIPWNKGKTDCYSAEIRLKMGVSNKGRAAWNKGKSTSENQRKKLSRINKGKPWSSARRAAYNKKGTIKSQE